MNSMAGALHFKKAAIPKKKKKVYINYLFLASQVFIRTPIPLVPVKEDRVLW